MCLFYPNSRLGTCGVRDLTKIFIMKVIVYFSVKHLDKISVYTPTLHGTVTGTLSYMLVGVLTVVCNRDNIYGLWL